MNSTYYLLWISSSFPGDLGTGKSTALKHIAQGWAKGTADELEQFDLVFYVVLTPDLKYQRIVDIVVDQHKDLRENNVRPEEIKAAIEESPERKVLLLLDGYDLYVINDPEELQEEQDDNVKIILGDIDNIIRKKHLENCWVILTSAETKQLIKVKKYLDAEASLQGFSYEEVRNYLTKYLGNSFLDKVMSHNQWHIGVQVRHLMFKGPMQFYYNVLVFTHFYVMAMFQFA